MRVRAANSRLIKQQLLQLSDIGGADTKLQLLQIVRNWLLPSRHTTIKVLMLPAFRHFLKYLQKLSVRSAAAVSHLLRAFAFWKKYAIMRAQNSGER